MPRQSLKTVLFVSLYAICIAVVHAEPPARQDGSSPNISPHELRSRFHHLLERPKVPLEPISTMETKGEFLVERGRFRSEASEQVPFVLYRPEMATGRLPVV